MKPCKHLPYDGTLYGEAADLVTIDMVGVLVRYWRRKKSQLPYVGAPVNVQFCWAGRGRINGIFDCYNEGERPCYEPEEKP